jgi:hypothetical protein
MCNYTVKQLLEDTKYMSGKSADGITTALDFIVTIWGRSAKIVNLGISIA